MIKNINPVDPKEVLFCPYSMEHIDFPSSIGSLPFEEYRDKSAYDLDIGRVYYCSFSSCNVSVLKFLGYAFQRENIVGCHLYYMFYDVEGKVHKVSDRDTDYIFTTKEDYVNFLRTNEPSNRLDEDTDYMTLAGKFPLGLTKDFKVKAYTWKNNRVIETNVEMVGLWIDKYGRHVEFSKYDLENKNLYFDRDECVNENLDIDDDFSRANAKEDERKVGYYITGSSKDMAEMVSKFKDKVKVEWFR